MTDTERIDSLIKLMENGNLMESSYFELLDVICKATGIAYSYSGFTGTHVAVRNKD